MKKAFTLQELLITVGIVGVVAAVAVPTVTNLMPDKNKTMYFRALNALTTVTKDMLNDDSLYWVDEYNDDGTPACVGLECKNMDIDSDGNALSFKDLWENNPEIHNTITSAFSNITDSSSGTAWLEEGAFYKYPLILMSKLSIQSAATPADCESKFITTDGIQWRVKVPSTSATSCKRTINTTVAGSRRTNISGSNKDIVITINVDPKVKRPTSKDCDEDDDVFKNSLECGADNPTVFKFKVENDGNIVINDKLGSVYMQTPTDFHRKKQDIEEAKNL